MRWLVIASAVIARERSDEAIQTRLTGLSLDRFVAALPRDDDVVGFPSLLRSAVMSRIAFPTPEPGILARRDAILAGLDALLPKGSLIRQADELRAFETDALTAYRR